MSTIKNVYETLKNAITVKENEDGTKKGVQIMLKSSNFPERKIFLKYNQRVNKLILEIEKYLQEQTTNEVTISKRILTAQLQDIAEYLKHEGIKVNGEAIQCKSYHISFILNHCLNLKITPDAKIEDRIKSETAIKKLIEQCFYYELNALPLPTIRISDKAAERMAKNAESIAKLDNATTVVKSAKASHIKDAPTPEPTTKTESGVKDAPTNTNGVKDAPTVKTMPEPETESQSA